MHDKNYRKASFLKPLHLLRFVISSNGKKNTKKNPQTKQNRAKTTGKITEPLKKKGGGG
jgi:hypothetical protein